MSNKRALIFSGSKKLLDPSDLARTPPLFNISDAM
jgi:hypothetical protein